MRRTRDALGDALVALMQEREFDSITVQDVLDRAGVGRSTFYVHYRDKDDLFTSDVDEFWSMMANRVPGGEPRRIAAIRELFTHTADMTDFMNALRAAGRIHDVLELGRLHFARAVATRLATIPATARWTPERRDGFAHAWAGAIMSMLEWWLSNRQPMPPRAADELLHEMLWRAIER